MKLFYRTLGEGKPLVILHGVFGSGDNLYTAAKALAESSLKVYLVDARNHGQSPHSETFDYDVMAEDLHLFLKENNIENPIIMGHSMGGKTVMQYAQKYDNFSKLIIVDIAPRYYPTHHQHIIDGLLAIKLDEIESRKEAEDIFSQYVSNAGERQFILKNLYRTEEGNFDWRINVPVIAKEIYQVGSEISSIRKIEKPVLFIRGAESSYISEEDFEQIKKDYQAELVTISGANHWVHATNPKDFVETVKEFCEVA